MFTYKIKEDKEEIVEKVLEKTGITIDFTLNDVIKHQKDLLKEIKGLKGQIDFDKAIVDNVETNHPFVKDFTEEQITALSLWIPKRLQIAKAEKMIKDREEVLTQYDEEIKEICKQLDLSLPTDIENYGTEQ